MARLALWSNACSTTNDSPPRNWKRSRTSSNRSASRRKNSHANVMSSFIESLNAAGQGWVAFGAATGLQTCILFTLLLALDLLLRRRVRAALRHAFWMLFLIKLLMPPSWSFPTGAGYWLATQK